MAAKKAAAKAAPRKTIKPAKPAPAPEPAPAPPAAAPPAPPSPARPARARPAPPPDQGPEFLAWVAFCLAAAPVAIELSYLAFSNSHFGGPDYVFVPLAAILMPAVGAILAATVLAGARSGQLRGGAHHAAVAALVLGVVVFATWGLWVLITFLLLAHQPSPQPCNFTCQASNPNPSPPPAGGCCHPCPSTSNSSSSGGGCCGPSGNSGGGGCGCGSSSGAGGSGGGGSLGTPGEGAAGTIAGVGSALALRSCRSDLWAHHPDTPRYRNDVYRIAGQRFCIGCSTTFPVFAAVAFALSFAGLPIAWSAALALGLGLAALQAVSAAGWARARWQKATVKASLGAGLALAVVAVTRSPWPPLAQAAALLAMAALAYASTVPRRRRMAAEANRT